MCRLIVLFTVFDPTRHEADTVKNLSLMGSKRRFSDLCKNFQQLVKIKTEQIGSTG